MATIRGFWWAANYCFNLFPSLEEEFDLPKLLPRCNNAVNTLQSFLNYLLMISITPVTASDMCPRLPL